MDKVLGLIKSIQDCAGKSPCKKTVQKIVYLIQEANQDLGFDYSIHFYGPYSAELDSEIRYLCNCGELGMEITKRGHELTVENFSDVSPLNATTQNIIEKFASKTPSELELLATALYVEREISNKRTENIIEGVVKIKGSKYSESRIKSAIHELNNHNYF